MKLTTLALSGAIALMVANPALAGHRHHSRHHYGHQSHNNHGRLVGGLIVGGLLGAAIANSNRHYYSDYSPRYRKSVYVNRYPSRRMVYSTPSRQVAYSTPSSTVRRTYWQESNGDCFLVNYNSEGDRVLVPVERYECE